MTYPVVDTTFTQGTTITSEWLNGVNDYVNESNPSDHSAANVTYDPPFTDSVATNVEAKLSQTVSVKDFGAVGDGITDDTAAIQAAIDSCVANGQFLYGDAGTYLVTSTLNMNCSGDLSEMTINADGTTFTPVIRVGKTTSYDSNLKLTLPKLNNTNHIAGDGWSGYENNVGVSLDNLYQSIITIPFVSGFGVGINAGGVDAGLSYNNITIESAQDNMVNLLVGPKDSGGWSNDNTYYIGRLVQFSSETNGGTPYAGTRNLKLSTNGFSNSPNNNVFIKPCVEGNAATTTEYFVELVNANFNTFIAPRWESNSGNPKIRLEGIAPNSTSGNNFIGGYGLSLDYTVVGTTYANSFFGNGRLPQTIATAQGGIALQNAASNGLAGPQLQGFDNTISPLGKLNSDTDWSYRLYANGLAGKRSTDAYSRLQLDFANGVIYVGNGSVSPTVGVSNTYTFGTKTVTIVGGIITSVV